jgi:hypothetical protein
VSRFIQQEFHVSHCKKSQDLSKICYRLLARKELSNAMSKNEKKRFVISPSKVFSDPKDAVCRYSQPYSGDCDAFNMN